MGGGVGDFFSTRGATGGRFSPGDFKGGGLVATLGTTAGFVVSPNILALAKTPGEEASSGVST